MSATMLSSSQSKAQTHLGEDGDMPSTIWELPNRKVTARNLAL